jgi:hypothetical protein
MRLFKLALISFVILFSIITGIGLLLPSKVIVSRAVDIKASVDTIYHYTKDLKKWKLWITSLQSSNIDNPLETKMGKSTIRIISTTKERVEGEWVEVNGDKQLMALSIIPSNQGQAIVQWQFEQQIKWYPWARFSSMVNDKVIGAMMEQNLANLKAIAENAK